MVTARLATTSFMNLQRPLTDAGHAQEAQIPPAVQKPSTPTGQQF